MKDKKVCPNGHHYSEERPSCPFCRSGNDVKPTLTDSDSGKGYPVGGFPNGTEVLPEKPPDDSGEQTGTKGRKTGISPQPEGPKENEGDTNGEEEPGSGVTYSRKLVGWIVTFTWNRFGDDYQIRMGKTIIGGREEDGDIVLPDALVSGNHCMLLYREGELVIQDLSSTNGTFVNGKYIGFAPLKLENGDDIRIGQTYFKVYLI